MIEEGRRAERRRGDSTAKPRRGAAGAGEDLYIHRAPCSEKSLHRRGKSVPFLCELYEDSKRSSASTLRRSILHGHMLSSPPQNRHHSFNSYVLALSLSSSRYRQRPPYHLLVGQHTDFKFALTRAVQCQLWEHLYRAAVNGTFQSLSSAKLPPTILARILLSGCPSRKSSSPVNSPLNPRNVHQRAFRTRGCVTSEPFQLNDVQKELCA